MVNNIMDAGYYTMYFPQNTLTMRGFFSQPLLAGLIQGFYIAAYIIAERTPDPKLREDILNSKYDTSYDAIYGINLLEKFEYGTSTYDIDNPLRDGLIKKIGTHDYFLVLRSYAEPGDENVDILIFEAEHQLQEFLQGLLTILTSFNIDPSTVFAGAPFKGDQDYMINNVRYPSLK